MGKQLNYDTNDINSGKTSESFVFKESKSKFFKELIKSLTPACDSSESDDDFLLVNTWCHPRESETQVMQAESFDYSHEFQMLKTQDLWEYREFEKSLTPKMGNNHDHLEQVRRFILKN